LPASLALRAAAELELRRRQALKATVPEGFGPWCAEVTPRYNWTWPHLVRLTQELDRITRGENDRLIVLMPPRHGKTECVTVRYPVHRIEKVPTTRIIQAGYDQTAAEKFSRKSRRIARDRGIRLSAERTAAKDWETAEGGGFRAVGVGAGIAGHGADLILIDDPIKKREEAESPVYRQKLWEWFTDDIWTRREPGAAVIVTLTPWHHDDLVGRIVASEDGKLWTVIRFPALAEPGDPLGRPEGAALCPERFDEAWLAQQRVVMGAYGFEGLYQCRPTPRSGNAFPRGKIKFVAAVPEGGVTCRAWDKAGTEGGGKRTAGVKMTRGPDKLIYVEDVRLGQWDASTRESEMLVMAALDGPRVLIELEQEPGSGGKESAQSSVKLLQGYQVAARPATGDKMTRADAFAAQWQAGNVRLVTGPDPNTTAPWIHAYLDELEISPSGKFTDQMDASAMAFNRITLYQAPTFATPSQPVAF